ncbi:BCD family MFS transporter [Roseomonas sp. PWR1]|uniref:BCD family MFS transporter n=1 Tax=Roseomonas nitratireducens TaxID=2820810 RepID=A0ABS4APN2_9PROT|nr:BCD family MFS transporter [Neoroseomonas nitratireducens]MBP0463324.1 BCD family MFS transporter [Neoroseomonas nitratireducens]
MRAPLGWPGILRLGLVQTALGAIVVLTTSALNRVMVVELALPATLPGLLVGIHYALQMLRPRWGYGSDMGGRRTPWILGGMAVLALGGVLAAAATALMGSAFWPGVTLAVLAFLMIGLGVGAAGTSLLVLLAARVDEKRRAAAASIVWIMMIAGFILTTAIGGRLLDPYSPERLVAVSAGVSLIAMVVATIGVLGIEGPSPARDTAAPAAKAPFRRAIADVWAEPEARRFTLFIFLSMLAYSAQDLILEPFAGSVFGRSLGESTQLSSLQNGGTLAGMVLVAVVGSAFGGRYAHTLKGWTIGGCLFAAATMLLLATSPLMGDAFPLATVFFALGVGNGTFAAAAIASMMKMVGEGQEKREGTRMGMWGAAQAVAFGIGGLAGAAAVDVARIALGAPHVAYAVVFIVDALIFVVAAMLAARIGGARRSRGYGPMVPAE